MQQIFKLLRCQELFELGSHLLVERPWQRVGNEGVVGNGVDVLDHVVQEVPVRARRERSKHHTLVSYTAILAPKKPNFKPSIPRLQKVCFFNPNNLPAEIPLWLTGRRFILEDCSLWKRPSWSWGKAQKRFGRKEQCAFGCWPRLTHHNHTG